MSSEAHAALMVVSGPRGRKQIVLLFQTGKRHICMLLHCSMCAPCLGLDQFAFFQAELLKIIATEEAQTAGFATSTASCVCSVAEVFKATTPLHRFLSHEFIPKHNCIFKLLPLLYSLEATFSCQQLLPCTLSGICSSTALMLLKPHLWSNTCHFFPGVH